MCYGDYNQQPDYENKKGTIIFFLDWPILNKVRPDYFGYLIVDLLKIYRYPNSLDQLLNVVTQYYFITVKRFVVSNNSVIAN